MALCAFSLVYVSAQQSKTFDNKLKLQLSYNSGRILSYIILWIIVSLFGLSITKIFGPIGIKILRCIAGVLLIITGLAIMGWLLDQEHCLQ